MSENQPRTCGACPNRGTYYKANENTDHLEKSTVPKPELVYQNRTTLEEHHHGVPKTNFPPDLTVSPEKSAGDGCCSGCNNKKVDQEEPCPDNPYAMEKCREKQPVQINRSPHVSVPNDYKQNEQMHLSSNPKAETTGPCYLPHPEDDMPKATEASMGPIGPWATGRVDWSPISGMTGTRPIVDKYSITRYSEGEWRRKNKEVLDSAKDAQHRANLVDWNGRRCLEQTRADVDKNQEDSTKRLTQRSQDLHRWKCELEMAIAAAAEEIGFLEADRRRLKTAAAVLTMPESIAGECLERRTGRVDTELVRDEVEEELIKELALIAEIRETFARTLKDVEMQLLEDKTAKQRLEYDWSDKTVTHQIEAVNCALNNRSNIMLFKPGSTIFPDDQSSKEHWEHFTRETLQEGEATRQRSITLRGTLDAILINASKDLRAQADRVDLALSRRNACNEQIRIALENELKNILQRLADVEDMIKSLRDQIRRMDIPMKKAQTRLDNRLQRPRVENCRDDAHYGLIEEVKTIGENVSALSAQLKIAEANQAELIKTRGVLEKEIIAKRKTLEIDKMRAQLIRSHYPSATALTGH
ncbi:hypothetical protein PPYR_09249 [Photinus pyralis]|uniref:Tektin n=3 Tax=Photinus pyralis TaxID=7054 RepID=A0A5N4ALS7_PHOPY|nr:tektin-4-like [Photinus pyralis]KAB0798256.1 hypothetical protein PPYR_09249 [Photinus pyralis]